MPKKAFKIIYDKNKIEFKNFKDLIKKTKYIFCNTQLELDFKEIEEIFLNEENLKEKVKFIGGIIATEPEPIKPETVELLELAKISTEEKFKGIIVVSFGTLISTKNMSVDLFQKYLNVFGSFKNYSFIWKFDFDNEKEDIKKQIPVPKNVKIQEGYIQQTTILNNELTKAVITHCGINSLLEGVYFQIPMVCIPNNSDQPYNAYAAELRGYVEEVDFRDENLEENLKKALEKVLNDEDWKENFESNTNELKGRMNKSKDEFIQAMKEMIGNQ
uniref:glucuronosyltransferase n=1 Tax=Meloidogyne enterolobii TaxID=390850 RepID=A0A6V7UC29_MELEN|nr:unnamed protein product [Meloidogyne enterolobii]